MLLMHMQLRDRFVYAVDLHKSFQFHRRRILGSVKAVILMKMRKMIASGVLSLVPY